MRNRRGAIVVMTGIFIVALMIIGAISVDASRIFAAKNELQTASDAGALAGAVQLLEDSTSAADSARAYAQRNQIESRTVDSVVVTYGVWRPATNTFIENGNPVDAVRVVTRHALPLSLARVFGDSTVTLTSSAVAWSSAPVGEAACAKPLAVPYSELLSSLGHPDWSDMDLTDDDILRLREMSEEDRTTHFHFGEPNRSDSLVDEHYKRAQYFPIDIDSTWNKGDPSTHDRSTVGPESFQSYVEGPPGGRCSRSVSPDDSVRSEPGNKREALSNGLSRICDSLGGSFVGTTHLRCRRPDGSEVGLPLKVVFWAGEYADWEATGNRAMLRARMTGGFVLREFKWEPDDPSGRLQHGRMEGYWDVKRDFGPINTTTASMLLRPVLVR